MKRITLIGLLVVGIMIVISLATAFNFGEKSPIYISGQVKIPDELLEKARGMETLFIVVFDQNSPMPMPYGAMKERVGEQIRQGKTSLDFLVTKEKLMLMDENRRAPGVFKVKARLDRDGVAGQDQPGDITGEAENLSFGSHHVEIILDRFIE